jgi:predicted RNA-binding Zn-ribbon protein involved in translation (DUF1610 family)
MLRRLFGQPAPKPAQWPPPGPITSWPVAERFDANLLISLFEPTGHTVEVMGESASQGTLDVLGGSRTIDGVTQPDQTALLMPEPTNPYDRNAVRVLIVPVGGQAAHWGKVGYLSRADAVAYRPVIDRLAELGRLAGCRAALTGGWDRGGRDRGSIGVRLHIGTPHELMVDIDDTHGVDPRWPTSLLASDAERPYDRSDCPSCGVELHPLPKAKKRCPSCGEAIYVRSGPDNVRHLLREADLPTLDAEWQEYWQNQDRGRGHMTTRQERASELVDELKAAHDGILELIGPRAVVVGSGEPIPRGEPIDESFRESWEAAKEREQRAWDAWLEFVAEGP